MSFLYKKRKRLKHFIIIIKLIDSIKKKSHIHEDPIHSDMNFECSEDERSFIQSITNFKTTKN